MGSNSNGCLFIFLATILLILAMVGGSQTLKPTESLLPKTPIPKIPKPLPKPTPKPIVKPTIPKKLPKLPKPIIKPPPTLTPTPAPSPTPEPMVPEAAPCPPPSPEPVVPEPAACPPPAPEPAACPPPAPEPVAACPTPGSTMPPMDTCPIDTLKLGVCGNLLGGLIGVIVGSADAPCCTLIQGLADVDAAVCLCTAIKANVLGINLNVPISLSLLLNACDKKLPSGFDCA